MESRTTSPVASAATLSDLHKHTHEHLDYTMGLDTPEQLLTPENSRSETSSNNDNASAEEKPSQRRRSTRVTRASLRGGAQLEANLEGETQETTSSSGDKSHAVFGETLVNNVTQSKRSQASHLRHSIAVMESSLWSETTRTQDNAETDNCPMAPDTPISKSSQEPQPDEMNTSLEQRTLRKRVEQALAQGDSPKRKKVTITDASEDQTPRRSSRLSILQKASDLVDMATSVLGKHSRSSDMMGKGKEVGRRASLRLRNVATPKEEPSDEPPAAKKRRLSESDLPSKTKLNEESKEEEITAKNTEPQNKSKRWLAHGLYTGQEYTTSRPSQNRNKNARRRDQGNTQRRYLPMPMFAGDRLLQVGRDFQLPFDIYSPLPPGQPKPDEWRKTNKNVFVGDASSIWRANKHMELSKCMCPEDTGCDENCQNRYMFYECDDGNCSVGPDCGNRSFDELKHRTKAGGKYNIGVEVIKTAERGYGVRSNRTFEPNQIIVEYTGEIITQSECEKRMRTVYKKNECYYLMYFDQNMIIDATRGSIARFVNHSCQPNCRMEKWTVAGKPRMALFAGDSGIMTGEELTYDYNFDPYSQKNVQQCRCGSSNCRGILGPRPSEKNQRREQRLKEQKNGNQKKKSPKKKNTKVAGTKRKNEQVLDESASRVNKKRRLLTSKSIKSGVKKAISKARASVSRSATSRKNNTAKEKAKASKETAKKNDAKPKKRIRLPKVKTTKTKVKTTKTKVKTTKTKVKASGRSKESSDKAKSPSKPRTSQPASKLSRPSANTKAKILAATKGTNARKRKNPKSSGAKGTASAKSSNK